MSELLYPITERSAELGGPGDCYRWSLSRGWMFGEGTAFWLLNNPSTADALLDDPTVLRGAAFSQRWGFRRMVFGNWSPYRSSSPAANLSWCRNWSTSQYADVLENANRVVDMAAGAGIRVMAFGNADHPILHRVVEDLSGVGPLHCIGMTAGGAPKHPLARGLHRVPITAQPVLWTPDMRISE